MSDDTIINLILALYVLLFPPACLYYYKWVMDMQIDTDLPDATPSSKKREWEIEPAIYRNNPK